MRKFLLCVVAAVCLLTSSFATTAVSGNLKDLITGSITSRTFVRFALANCGANQPRVNGTGLVAPNGGPGWYQDFTPDVNGAISGTIYSNTEITCGLSTNTWYYVSVWRDGKEGPRAPYLLSGVPFNLNTASPMSTAPSPVINPSYVLLNPSGDQTIVQPASTFLQVSGGFKVSSGALPITAATGGIGSVALPFANVTIGSGANQSAQLSGSFTANRTVNIPDANSNTVQTFTAPAHQFATAVSSAGVFTTTQPAFGDISGVATILQGGTGQTTGDYTAAFGAGPSYAGVSYATITLAYAACTSGKVLVPPGYTETFAANLVLKNDCGIEFTGTAVITLGSFGITSAAGVKGAFIRAPLGLGSHASPTVKFVYTGTGTAMAFGDSSADTGGLNLLGFILYMNTAGGSAKAITLTRVSQAYMEQVTAIGPGGATSQVGLTVDGSTSVAAHNTGIQLDFEAFNKNLVLQSNANANVFVNLNVGFAGTGGVGVTVDGTVNQVEENAFYGVHDGGDTTGISAVGLATNNHFHSVMNDSGITTDVNFGASATKNTVWLMLPTWGVIDAGTNNSVIDPSTYKLTSGGAMTLGIAASSPGTISLAKGVGGGALFTIASGATTPWTMTSKATAPAQGDLYTFSNATGQMATVADVATGQVLVSGGANAVPAYSATPTVTSITTGTVQTGTLGAQVAYNRMKATVGTALVTGDVTAIGAGFGNTATASTVIGTDAAFFITIAATGTGQAANPAITLTFHDGTWANSPIMVCTRADTNSPIAATWTASSSGTTALVTFIGTPVASTNYSVGCHAIGR